MNSQEIFEKLQAMRNKIEADTEEPMHDSDDALLYDVAKALGLSEEQAAILSGDIEPETAPIVESENPHDFSHSGLGIGGAGSHNLQAEAAEMIARHGLPRTIERKSTRCDCGHSVPDGLVMSASMGTSCPDCYDRMSDG